MLILGGADPQVRLLDEALSRAGEDAVHRLDTRDLAEEEWAWDPGRRSARLPTEPEPVRIEECSVGFWRYLNVPDFSESFEECSGRKRNFGALLKAFLAAIPFPLVNGPDAYRLHQQKPRLLAWFDAAGVPVPDTIVTNSPEEARDFIDRHGSAVTKPVWGGEYAREFVTDDEDAEALAEVLAGEPTTVQETIPGRDVRTYVVGTKTFTVEIQSEELDFRRDENHELEPVQLPEEVMNRIPKIMDLLELEWTAIDWRRTPEGTYYFLEANFSPMFAGVQEEAGFPIAETLAEYLLERKVG